MLNYWRHKTTTAYERAEHMHANTHETHTHTYTHTHTQPHERAGTTIAPANRNNTLRCIVNLNRRKDISRILSWQATHTHWCVSLSFSLFLSLFPASTLAEQRALVVHAVHVASAALYLDCCLVVARATYSPPTPLPYQFLARPLPPATLRRYDSCLAVL